MSVPDSFFSTTVAFWWGSGIVAVAGGLVQLAAWIGALVNTNRLADKTWFNLLLWVGIIGAVDLAHLRRGCHGLVGRDDCVPDRRA